MIGQVVAGRYEIEELLGTGGMSSVFRAHDTVLERRVALKVLHDHHSSDPEYVERFRREARAIAKLAHPNIVTVIDRGEFEGRQYIVFEHVGGENLKELVEREGRLPVGRALALAHQVARGLAFAHEHGIIHRDVKPHNVLLDDEGTAKVTDFGIARSLEPADELTQTGTLLGTSDYIAPEQASGARVDERTDQYALGVLLFELLTGRVPYPGESFMATAVRHLRDPVPSVRALAPEVPPRVEAIVRRAMAKAPQDRFPSTEAMLGALEAALADEAPPPVGKPARPSAPARPGARRRSVLPLLLALLVVGVGAFALAFVVTEGELGAGDPREGEGAAEAQGADVTLRAVRDYDPEGGDGEHPERVAFATDGDPSTYWTTETYRTFQKSGVGIVLDAGAPVELSELTLVSDEPGFTARIQAGESRSGPFEDVSGEEVVGEETTFELDAGGAFRFWVVWITDPNGRAHVNEVRAGGG